MGNARRPGRLGLLLLKAPVLLYRWRIGFLLGGRFLLVNHVGRRSGRPYQAVVEVIGRHGNRWYVMSGFGRNSDWYLNLKAAGNADVRVGRRNLRMQVRELDSAAAAGVVGDYERRNRFLRPVVRRALSRQVGWRYTGTAAARRRLVDQLPILELTSETGAAAMQ